MVKEKGLSTDGGKEGMLAALAFHSRGGMSGESASAGDKVMVKERGKLRNI